MNTLFFLEESISAMKYNKPEDWIMESKSPTEGTTVFYEVVQHLFQKK